MNFEIPFRNWINEISRNEILPKDILAFNFGLFQNRKGYSLYLIGSQIFDPNNDDWACNEDFHPHRKYLKLEASEITALEWQSVLDLVQSTASEYIRSSDYKTSILKNAVAITIGFDSGELIRIK